jgi:HEPN domain-containing protein
MDRWLAIHHAHQAVELTLRAKAEQVGANPYDFPSAVKALKNCGVTIPYERKLDELNKASQLIQHYNTVPDERDAYRLVTVSQNSMKDFCATAFGVNHRELSAVEMISNDDIRKIVQEAFDAREDGRFEDAAMAAHLAIEKTKWAIQRKIRPRKYRHRLWSHGLALETLGLRELPDVIEDIREDLDHTFDVALWAPFAYDLKRLSDMTHAVFYTTGNGQIVRGKGLAPFLEEDHADKATSDDADFGLELATEYILWAEQVYGL